MPATRYDRLVSRYAAAIRSGELRAGTRLPTHRALAATESVAVVTATRIYAELDALGLVSRERGRGTFVRDTTLPPGHGVDQSSRRSDVADLNFNQPTLPGQTALLREGLRDLAGTGDLDAMLRYQPHGGRPHDRATLSEHLLDLGLDVAPGQVLVVSGAQHGIAVALMTTLDPGAVLAVDELTYPGLKVLAGSLRVRLEPIPSTADGMDLTALDRACADRDVRAVYTMPTLHNPLGSVASQAARTRLAGIAEAHDLVLVEDGAYAFLAEDAPPPLATTAPDRTIHLASLSKSLAPGLRVGTVTAPARLVPALERTIRATTWNTPALMVALACRWLRDGTAASLVAEKRRDARACQQVVLEELGTLGPVGHPSSYFTWLPLPQDVRADLVAARLEEAGVSVATAAPFATGAATPQALRLALATTEMPTLSRALGMVREAVLAEHGR